jgi:flagellar biosynthetic protein FliP
MFSPSLHTALIQSQIDDRDRKSSAMSRPGLARRGRRSAEDGAGHDGRSTYRFFRHYVEMVVVMFAGMFVLMPPTGWLFSAFGTSWSELSPAMYTFAMAMTMTVPMVVWMRYRGHTLRPNVEMAASMLIPTFVVMGAQLSGLASSGLTVPEHAGMLTCMLGAMLLRRDEYSCAAHGHGGAPHAVAA